MTSNTRDILDTLDAPTRTLIEQDGDLAHEISWQVDGDTTCIHFTFDDPEAAPVTTSIYLPTALTERFTRQFTQEITMPHDPLLAGKLRTGARFLARLADTIKDSDIAYALREFAVLSDEGADVIDALPVTTPAYPVRWPGGVVPVHVVGAAGQ
jgi:hypothetical protein